MATRLALAMRHTRHPRILVQTTPSLTRAARATDTLEQQRRTMAHTVRIIAMADLPHGQAYQGDVLHVKAGYFRNHLHPHKLAVYATRNNFEKLGIQDPDTETAEQRAAREAAAAAAGSAADDEELKAADVLKHYLRNKVLKIWRNADPVTNLTTPGFVDAKAVRQKLSKQLRIDLDPDEKVHLRAERLVASSSSTAASASASSASASSTTSEQQQRGGNEDAEMAALMEELGDPAVPCTAQVRQLGEYLARISLRGGYSVPLRVEVLKR